MSAGGGHERTTGAAGGGSGQPDDVPAAAPAPANGAPLPVPGPADAAALSDPELRTVLRLTRAQIAYFGPDGRVLFATPALSQALGLRLDEVIGRTVEEMGIPPTRSRWMRELGVRAAATRQPMLEIVSFVEDGVSVDRQVAMEPDVAPDGTVKGFVVTAWDITALRQAARRIVQLDRVYAILSETNQAIVRAHDRDDLFADACRIAAGVGGFELCWIGLVEPNGEILTVARAGLDVAVLDGVVVSTRDEPAGRGAVGSAIRENRVVVVEDAVGDERMAQWRGQLAGHGFRTAAAFPLRLGGKPIGAFALYSSQPGYFDAEDVRLFEELAGDLSFALDQFEAEREKAAAQEALRESEHRFRDLFESNPIPMWVFDVETLRFGAVNDAAVARYGWSREEFLGMTLADIRPPEDIDAMLASVAAPGEGYRPSDLWRHRRKDGTIIDVEVSGHDILFNGRKARVIAAIDVTERRRLEAQLAEATRMEAMGHLAGGIAHDFNNLLTAVNGYAELLVTELGDGPLAEDAREIRRAGARAAELTRQVLAFASRQVLAPRPVDLNEVVGGVGQMLHRLIGEQIKLVLKHDREPAVVMADPGQLEQVLVNLAINARDAMPEGGTLQIGVSHVPEADGLGSGSVSGPAVLLTVVDTGVGMDAETLAHAFEPFFTTKQAGAGTGLGLATVYGIVRQSNGEIWAESTAGAGTKVSVLLHRVQATPEPLARPVPVVSDTVAAATILVVEDEPAVRALVVSTLERAGYRVMVTASPAEAIALAEGLDAPIDLLLTDLIMPGANGQALAERLLQKRPSMRVVLMSGYGAGLGPITTDAPFHFIAKPFGRDELMTAVARVLSDA